MTFPLLGASLEKMHSGLVSGQALFTSSFFWVCIRQLRKWISLSPMVTFYTGRFRLLSKIIPLYLESDICVALRNLAGFLNGSTLSWWHVRIPRTKFSNQLVDKANSEGGGGSNLYLVCKCGSSFVKCSVTEEQFFRQLQSMLLIIDKSISSHFVLCVTSEIETV